MLVLRLARDLSPNEFLFGLQFPVVRVFQHRCIYSSPLSATFHRPLFVSRLDTRRHPYHERIDSLALLRTGTPTLHAGYTQTKNTNWKDLGGEEKEKGKKERGGRRVEGEKSEGRRITRPDQRRFATQLQQWWSARIYKECSNSEGI